MKKTQHGFTLIELLVVMAIIGILAAILVPLAPKLIGTAKRNKAKGEVNTIAVAVKSYYTDYGRMPFTSNSSTDIVKVLTASEGSSPTYNPRETVYLELETSSTSGEFLDPWGRQYDIFLDLDYDNKINFDGGDYRTTCIAVSRGPNGATAGSLNTDSDDITTAK